MYVDKIPFVQKITMLSGIALYDLCKSECLCVKDGYERVMLGALHVRNVSFIFGKS